MIKCCAILKRVVLPYPLFKLTHAEIVLCVFCPRKKTGQTVKNANACNTVQSSTLIIALLESCEFDVNIMIFHEWFSYNVYIAQNKKSPNSFVEEKLGIERDETVMDDGLEEMIMNPGIGLLALLYSVVEIHYDKLCKEGIWCTTKYSSVVSLLLCIPAFLLVQCKATSTLCLQLLHRANASCDISIGVSKE